MYKNNYLTVVRLCTFHLREKGLIYPFNLVRRNHTDWTKEGTTRGWGKYSSWSGSLKFIGIHLNLVHWYCRILGVSSTRPNHLVEPKKVLQMVEVSKCFLKWLFEVHRALVRIKFIEIIEFYLLVPTIQPSIEIIRFN